METLLIVALPLAFLLGFAIVGAINRRIAEKKDIADEIARADMYCFLTIDDAIINEQVTVITRKII